MFMTRCRLQSDSESSVLDGSAESHLGLQVRSDPDDTPLHGHLEGEADDASDLQQSLLTQTPATLNISTVTS